MKRENIIKLVNSISVKEKVKISFAEKGRVITEGMKEIILSYDNLKVGGKIFAGFEGDQDHQRVFAPVGTYDIEDKKGNARTVIVNPEGVIEDVKFSLTENEKFSRKLRDLGAKKTKSND